MAAVEAARGPDLVKHAKEAIAQVEAIERVFE